MNNSSIPNNNSWSIQTWLTDDSLTVESYLLEQAVLTSQSCLRDFAEDSAFLTKMATIFGEETSRYHNLQDAWLNNVNAGATLTDTGQLQGAGNSVLNNASGSTFDIQSDVDIVASTGGVAFNNAGTVIIAQGETNLITS